MLTKMKLALALCAATLVGGVALADTGSSSSTSAPTPAMKEAWKAKREARKAELLAKYDTNHDGKLDEQERAVMRDEMLTARFEKMDLNKDGQISLEEFKKFSAEKGGKFRHGRGGFGRHHRKGLAPSTK
jgi:Ca2+-binding EF-hand superfamily protein